MVLSSHLKQQFRQEQLRNLQSQPLPQDLSLMWSALQDLMKRFPGLWGLFYPLKSEPNLLKYLGLNLNGFAFPKCQNSQLEFYTEVTHFKKGDLGVTEPITGRLVLPQEMVGLLVPAVCYCPAGYRLGRGRGYYDRYLAHYPGVKVGICFESQVVPQIPQDSWDQRVNYIITNQQVRDVT